MKDSEFLHILAKYKFVLAIENAVCPDYITEKLWKVLQVGAVPVYFGAPNVQVCMVIHGPLLLDRLVNQNPFRHPHYVA